MADAWFMFSINKDTFHSNLPLHCVQFVEVIFLVSSNKRPDAYLKFRLREGRSPYWKESA